MANSKYTFLTKLIILVAISFAITYLYIFRNIEEMKEFFGWSFIPSILATFPIIINIFLENLFVFGSIKLVLYYYARVYLVF